MKSPIYRPSFTDFHFNDHVCMEMVHLPIEKRSGRIVQVRIGRGAFGTDLYIARLRDGSLSTFENVLMRHVGDRKFEKVFYRSHGEPAPEIPDQPPFDGDSLETEYTIQKLYPETGFIIENSAQPLSPTQSFSMMVAKSRSA